MCGWASLLLLARTEVASGLSPSASLGELTSLPEKRVVLAAERCFPLCAPPTCAATSRRTRRLLRGIGPQRRKRASAMTLCLLVRIFLACSMTMRLSRACLQLAGQLLRRGEEFLDLDDVEVCRHAPVVGCQSGTVGQ